MKNATILSNKCNNLLVCDKCGFFPLSHELQNCTTDKNLFKIEWCCQNCKSQNICPSDSLFKIYSSHYQFSIDETINNQRELLVLIDASATMLQNYVNLPRSHINRKIGQLNKKLMIQESPLLTAYLQDKIIQNRAKKGRYLSWENVLRQRQLTKIEYALWFVDFLSKSIKNIKIVFFDEDFNIKDINKQSSALTQSFLKKISTINSKNLRFSQIAPKIQSINFIQFSQKLSEIVVFSGSQLNKVQKNLDSRLKKNLYKVILINLQQQIDSITLNLTSTGQYLRTDQFQPGIIAHTNQQQSYENNPQNKIQIFDIRTLQNVLQKQFASLIQNILRASSNQISVFTRRVTQTHSQIKHQHVHVSKRMWQKMITKNEYNNFIRRKLKQIINQSTHSRIFNSDKNKSTQILIQFNNLINKNNVTIESIKQCINYIHMNVNKNSEIRIYFKLFGYHNDNRVMYTVLWNNYKNKYNVINYDNNCATANKTSDEEFVYVEAYISGSNEQFATISEQSNSYSGGSNSSSSCQLCEEVKRRNKNKQIVENDDYQYL